MATAGQAESECTEHQWTFLTNYTLVLYVLRGNPEILQREVAERIGVSEHWVQRIISELEGSGYVTRERIGRRNRYRVDLSRPLRQPEWQHWTIGQLLDFLADDVRTDVEARS